MISEQQQSPQWESSAGGSTSDERNGGHEEGMGGGVASRIRSFEKRNLVQKQQKKFESKTYQVQKHIKQFETSTVSPSSSPLSSYSKNIDGRNDDSPHCIRKQVGQEVSSPASKSQPSPPPSLSPSSPVKSIKKWSTSSPQSDVLEPPSLSAQPSHVNREDSKWTTDAKSPALNPRTKVEWKDLQQKEVIDGQPSTPSTIASTPSPNVASNKRLTFNDQNEVIPPSAENTPSPNNLNSKRLSFNETDDSQCDRGDDNNGVIPPSYVDIITSTYGPNVNLYYLLQVDENASLRDIRIAYFRQGRQVLTDTHDISEQPNKKSSSQSCGGSISGEKKTKFRVVSMAYEILSTPSWRDSYDNFGLQLQAGSSLRSKPNKKAAEDDSKVNYFQNEKNRNEESNEDQEHQESNYVLSETEDKAHSSEMKTNIKKGGVRWNEEVEELVYDENDDIDVEEHHACENNDAENDAASVGSNDGSVASAGSGGSGSRKISKRKLKKVKKKRVKNKVVLESSNAALTEHLKQLDKQAEKHFINDFLDDIETSLEGLLNFGGSTIEKKKDPKKSKSSDKQRKGSPRTKAGNEDTGTLIPEILRSLSSEDAHIDNNDKQPVVTNSLYPPINKEIVVVNKKKKSRKSQKQNNPTVEGVKQKDPSSDNVPLRYVVQPLKKNRGGDNDTVSTLTSPNLGVQRQQKYEPEAPPRIDELDTVLEQRSPKNSQSECENNILTNKTTVGQRENVDCPMDETPSNNSTSILSPTRIASTRPPRSPKSDGSLDTPDKEICASSNLVVTNEQATAKIEHGPYSDPNILGSFSSSFEECLGGDAILPGGEDGLFESDKERTNPYKANDANERESSNTESKNNTTITTDVNGEDFYVYLMTYLKSITDELTTSVKKIGDDLYTTWNNSEGFEGFVINDDDLNNMLGILKTELDATQEAAADNDQQ